MSCNREGTPTEVIRVPEDLDGIIPPVRVELSHEQMLDSCDELRKAILSRNVLHHLVVEGQAQEVCEFREYCMLLLGWTQMACPYA